MKTKEENKAMLTNILVTLKNQKEVEQSYYNLIKFEEINDDLHKLVSNQIKFIFGEDVLDWIEWWLYEDVNKIIYLKSEGNKKINIEKMEDFVEYLLDLLEKE